MCWSRWNIHLPSTTYLSIDLSTYPTTYLPKSIYPSIYLSLASRGIDCSRPCPLRPGRPWSHGTAGPRPFHWTPKALAWKARPSMASFGLRLAFSAAAYSDFPPRWRESRVPHKKHLRAILWRRLLLQEVCRGEAGLLLGEPQPHVVCRNSAVGVPWVILRHARRTIIYCIWRFVFIGLRLFPFRSSCASPLRALARPASRRQTCSLRQLARFIPLQSRHGSEQPLLRASTRPAAPTQLQAQKLSYFSTYRRPPRSCFNTQKRFHTRFCTQTRLHSTQTLLHTDAFDTQKRLHTDAFTPRRFYTQTLLHTDAFTHKRFYTQMLLHTNTFTHRDFYTQTLSHTEAFTHRHFYTQKLLHTKAFTRRPFYTQNLLHTETFTHRRFYTQKLLHADPFTHRCFYTQTLWHTEAFTHRRVYTQTLLHTDTFTHRRFYTQTLLHTEAFTRRPFYTQKLLHTNTFTHRDFYTQTLSHTQRLLHTDYTQKLLHTKAFTHKKLLHTEAFTHRHFYTQTLLHTETLTHRSERVAPDAS